MNAVSKYVSKKAAMVAVLAAIMTSMLTVVQPQWLITGGIFGFAVAGLALAIMRSGQFSDLLAAVAWLALGISALAALYGLVSAAFGGFVVIAAWVIAIATTVVAFPQLRNAFLKTAKVAEEETHES